ncbi:hypothetical protein DEO72_LG1g1620 [Vigna unguiculata]|uniref:Uncharacterized protein n=1 Tax=Vigna unguiculata TaxID=3917 RepID=A0A4D6KTX9_VIGUN|nr:hypothetical protein DEO72_LG1g1620 [Vigna unguiculata]
MIISPEEVAFVFEQLLETPWIIGNSIGLRLAKAKRSERRTQSHHRTAIHDDSDGHHHREDRVARCEGVLEWKKK